MALHPGGCAAGRRAEGVIEGHAAALDQRHRQAEFAADGSNLRTDEAAADDQDPAWTGGQPLAQPRRIVARADGKDPIQRGLVLVRPLPGPRASGNQQAVKLDLLTVGELYPAAD